MKPIILFSFDAEEFDTPLDYDAKIPLEQQIEISRYGIGRILEILQRHNVKATFFCTAKFAKGAKETILQIRDRGHEIASHGFEHGKYDPSDPRRSKITLDEMTEQEIVGYRRARMQPVEGEDLVKSGYLYDASLNPTFIPGRYSNLSMPRKVFKGWDGIIHLPAAVTPTFRFPLFWLSFHHLPFGWYKWMFKRTLLHDRYLCTYFHPWEFYPLKQNKELKLPYLIYHNSGKDMERRFEKLIEQFEKEAQFLTISDFLKIIKKKKE